MPSPLPAPRRPSAPALPSNFDALVREALAGGDIGKLKSAMSDARHTEPAPSLPPPLAPSPPAVEEPEPVDVARPPSAPPHSGPAPQAMPSAPAVEEEQSGGDPYADALQAVVEAARAALAVHGRGRPPGTGLQDIQLALDHAKALCPPSPAPALPLVEPHLLPELAPKVLSVPVPVDPPVALPVQPTRVRPPVVLPPYRHRWMLVIHGPGDASLGPKLAAALDVDGVTARFAAIARTPRVALRGEDAEPLRSSAVRVQRLGIPAVVVSREELEGIAAPDVVLAADGDARFTVSATWPWDGDAPPELPPDARSLPLSGMVLAVPGEVTVRRYRLGRSLARGRRSEQVLRLGTERRLQVVDLHGPGRFLRLVAGLTNTTGLPGHDDRSALRAFQGLTEGLPDWIRGCSARESRVCAPGEAPRIPEGYDGSTAIEASGWAQWEEHTRLCRLLCGLDSRDVPVERA